MMRILENMVVPECNRGGNFLEKIRIFLPCRVGHQFCSVFPCLDSHKVCPEKSADNERTFWVPLSGTASQNNIKPRHDRNSLPSAIENKADGNSGHRLRAVMFYSVVPRRGTHKSPKIVCGLRTHLCGMSQTWKNTDHPGCPTRNG